MDSDSTADEDDQNLLPFSSSNEHHVNFSCDEDENSRVFCFNDGYMTELTDSSKADLVDLQTSSRMNFLTDSEGISHCSTKIGESLSQTHNELLADSVTEKCEYNEEKSAKNEHQKKKEYEKILSVEMKKSCDVENNTVARFFQTEEKDELIKKMANHIKCIWNILLQFGDKLDKAELLTEKEKLVIQGEYKDGYLPLKISQDEGEKDNQLFLSRLLVSSFEEPGEFSLCTNNCNSSYPNTHLKDTDITPSEYYSPLSTSVCDEETSRNNINPSTFQNKHVHNPVIKLSKARKSFTRSHKSHHLQDKKQQNMMPIPHNPLNSKNETINSCVDDKKDPFQTPSKQALHEQDTPSQQKLLVEDSSVTNIEMSNTEIKETIQSADSVTGLIQNDLVLSGEESDQVKSNEIQNIFLCKYVKNLERNLVESPAINLNTATSAKKMARECDALLKDQISASDISYSISSRLSNDKIISLDSLNAKTLLDKLNNPFVKQAKARKKISKNQNSTHSLEEKNHLKSTLSIGMSNLENNIGICGKQKSNIDSSFKQRPCIEAEDSFTEKVADSLMPTSINGIKKSYSQTESMQLNFSQQGHEFQDTVSFGHNPKSLDSQENNNSMKQKVLLKYKNSLKKQTVGDSSDIDHNLSESNETVEKQDLLLTEKESFRTQSKQTYSVGSNYQLENDLTLSDEDDTLNCDLERNSSKSQTSSLKHFDACPAIPESIGSSHKCEENAFSVSDHTFAESQNVNSSTVDSSSNEVVGISCTNINKLHSEFLGSPIIKKAKARKKFSRKQNLDHSVNNRTQQNALSDSSFDRLNSEKGIISSFTENLKIDASLFQACNSNREEPFLMKYPRHSPESSELGVCEENKITEKTSQALCNINGNTIELNPIICGPPLRDSAALNRDMRLISEDMSKNNDFVEQNSVVVSSAKNSSNEGNNDDLTQLYDKESSKVSLIEKGSCNIEYEKMSGPPNKNADQCGPDFWEDNNIEQKNEQRKNFVECGIDAWKNLDDISTATSDKLITSQTCSKNLLSVHTSAVFENISNPVNSGKSENSSSADQSPDKDVSVSRGIFTLFQNSILNPFIEQAKAREKVTKKPNSASSHGKVPNVSCNFSSQILCDKMKTTISEKENTQIGGLSPKQNSEVGKENIKEFTFTKDICTPVVKFINQTRDEERKSFIQNSFSIPSTSISQLEASHLHSRSSVSENELKSNACIERDFVQENPVSKDFDFVTVKSISCENNFISKAPLQLDPMISEDGVLTTENVTNDNPGESLHSTKSIDLLKNDLAISDDETDELCEFEKDKSTEVLTTSFSKNLNLISESKKVQSNGLNLGNNSSHLSNEESAYQNNNLPSKNLFYNLSQTAFRLDNIVKLQNSSSPKNQSYLSQRTNTSFDEYPVKEKPNIPDTAGTEMVHGHLNEESIELPVKAQLLESTSKRKRAEDFDLDHFAKNPIKKSFNGLSSEESSLSNKIINSILHGPSVSANWEKFPVTTQDSSGSVEEYVIPGIHILNNNISESKEKLSSTIDNVNSSIKGPLKKKLKPVDSVTACVAPIRVRGRTSQFRAFSKKFSNEFDKNSKDNGYGNSNEFLDNSLKNYDQDKIIESYISTKKPKIRKEHQKVKNSNKTLISHNTGTVLNLKEASSEYSAQFSQQDAKISLKEPAVSSEFSEQCELFTTSKSHLMIQSSTEDKIEALNKTPKAENSHKKIGNEKNTYTLFDNAMPEKNMNLIFSVKEKDLEDKSLELCSSIKPPPDLNNGESIVNGCANMLSINNKIKFMHTESECLTSNKRILNSEMEPVTKKNHCSRNSESTIANSSSSKNISSLSENLFLYDNLVSKTMEENWHFESDSDRELLIDEDGDGKDLKGECLELCSSSVDPPPDLSSRESIVNGSENKFNIDNKIKCLPSKSKGFTSKKRPLNSDNEPVMKKQNCSGNSGSTIANSSSSKSIFTSTDNFSARDNSLTKAIEDGRHLENDSDQNLVINEGNNDKPGTYDNSVDEHFQETSEKLSNAKSSCLDLLEEICNFDKDSYDINFKNIPSDNNETSFSKPLLPSKSSLNSAQISASSKSENFPLDEILSEGIVTSISISSSITNFQNINQTSITVSKTKTAAASNPVCKSSDAIIVPKFSKQKSTINAKEGFIKKGKEKFQHSKLVESIIANKNCKSVKNEADLPFSLGIEEILDNIRGVHADSESFKNYVDSLTKFLIYPQNAPDTAVLIFLVVHYLHLRRANLLLKFLHNQEGYPFLMSTENCIVTALIEIEKMAKPHLQGFLKSLLSVMYNLILEKKKLNFYGMSSLCRVFTELCKRNGDKQKPIFLCCDLIKQKHRNSPFLIASIAGVWKELFEIPDDFSDEHITLLSSIAYGAQKRIPKISKSCQECSSKIIEEYITVPSIPNAKQAIELLKEQIVSKSLQSSFENLWCLTSSLVILASWEPWKWTEQTLLNDYIVTNLKRFSSQHLNEQAFDLFCNLYVDIYFLAPTKFADKVLIKFVERNVASKEKEFVQDCAAAALMKYLILAKREVPASLTVFFGKNPDNPKTKLFEDILRRRIPTSAEKLSIKDIMNYV